MRGQKGIKITAPSPYKIKQEIDVYKRQGDGLSDEEQEDEEA